MNKLQQEFEATGYISWIDSEIYPEGKIHTREYVDWLEKLVKESRIPALPVKAKHRLFGDVEITGVRIECASNNNKMYQVKKDGKHIWVYDYETELVGNNVCTCACGVTHPLVAEFGKCGKCMEDIT